jgi:hypothetical protein
MELGCWTKEVQLCYVNKVKEDRASKSRSWRDGARVLVAHATNTNWQENS